MRASCEIHAYHSPHVESTDRHHVLPLRWGRAPDPRNEVVLCPTGHRNVHELLRLYAAFGGPPPWEWERGFSPAERALARRAWEELGGDRA